MMPHGREHYPDVFRAAEKLMNECKRIRIGSAGSRRLASTVERGEGSTRSGGVTLWRHTARSTIAWCAEAGEVAAGPAASSRSLPRSPPRPGGGRQR
jgi:hypothetical protein